ncbi:MAG: 2,3-bisphosphoglycerate-dependent phosphoglycerate mutase [Candidatus Thermoplasmatota archaeon]
MAELVLVRHGQSQWNLENRFTGWVDVPLSRKGIEEAINAGKKLQGYHFDVIYVSHMLRALQTLHYILLELSDNRTPIIHHEETRIKNWEHYNGDKSSELPIYQTVELAERYYGDLQGLNKSEMMEKYGRDQVQLWRRSYDVNPPGGESLKDTCNRTIPYYERYIQQDLKKGKNILIVAHGNSLRSIIKHVEQIPDKDIPNVEIPTGLPILYTFDDRLQLVKKTIL